jgi:hypothetical protein
MRNNADAGGRAPPRRGRQPAAAGEVAAPAGRERVPADLLVIEPLGEWACASCGGSGAFLRMEDAGPLCLACGDLDHLVFLPAGDAALSRRARQASRLSAVVVRFSRARRRYERQGLLVEEAALESAEARCLADEEARRRRRERDRARRAEQDLVVQARLAEEIVPRLPGCPAGRAEAIARHAGARGSGRVALGGRAGAGGAGRVAGGGGFGAPPGHRLRRAADGRRAPRAGPRHGAGQRRPGPGRMAAPVGATDMEPGRLDRRRPEAAPEQRHPRRPRPPHPQKLGGDGGPP